MCYNGKCFYFIPVKTACFISAIINAIANGLVLIWCCIMLFCWFIFGSGGGVTMKIGGVRFKRDVVAEAVHNTWLPWEFWLPMLTVSSLLTLIFSILLCNGVAKGRWKHVKAYFIYGSVLTVLWVLASVIQLCTNHSLQIGLWGLFVCVLHSCFLVLVHQTYRHLLQDAGFSGHIRLEDFDDTRNLV